jgi:predicted dehydrogenase
MLNVALIGTGNIGLLFDTNKSNPNTAYSHIKSIYLNKNLNLKYVVDIDTKYKKLIKDFFPNVKFYTNYKKLTYKTDIDILTIATPTSTHFNILNSFQDNQNIKIFFIEKPLFQLKSQYKILSKNITNKIIINYPRRFDKAIKNIKKNIKDTEVEKVVINYCKGLKNNGSHLIDMINLIFDKPKIIEKRILSTSDKFDDNDLTYDIFVKINYKNKIIPLYFISHNHTKYNLIKLEIYTQKQKIEYNNSLSSVNYFNIISHPTFPTYKIFDIKATYCEKVNGAFHILNAYKHIINVIKKDIKIISSYQDEITNMKFYYKLIKDSK